MTVTFSNLNFSIVRDKKDYAKNVQNAIIIILFSFPFLFSFFEVQLYTWPNDAAELRNMFAHFWLNSFYSIPDQNVQIYF